MSAVLAVASGVLGSIIGSLANYFLALWLGRGFVRRFGKYFLMSEKSLERSERFFAKHGEISVLLGRMLPVVRHLISIPAGLTRMSLPAFVGYTAAGATVWCGILTWIGYFLGQHEGVLRHADVQRYVSRALLIVVPVLAVIVGIYVVRQRRKAAYRGGRLGRLCQCVTLCVGSCKASGSAGSCCGRPTGSTCVGG